MKKIIALIIITLIGSMVGYQIGIYKATTSEGQIQQNSFILEVNGQIYEWIIDDYNK